jgi:hypothetical protein
MIFGGVDLKGYFPAFPRHAKGMAALRSFSRTLTFGELQVPKVSKPFTSIQSKSLA